MGKSSLPEVLVRHRGDFHTVVPFIPGKDTLIQLDFTSSNAELTDELIADTSRYTAYISDKIKSAKARYGIGGYSEHRMVYKSSKVFDAPKPGEEPRRLHLGIDIWGKPNTAVMAPLDGIVHSFGVLSEPGNYGGVIILSHHVDGVSFYTLYGHLSLNSIKNLQENERVEKGDVIAEFGIPSENGHWPPHLHFQIIQDLGGNRGDYPGVCKYSEREMYLTNCPDPDLILNLNSSVA
jgi:murein DD-endopeptidase MepM/ murein hydrolase activator NlpD